MKLTPSKDMKVAMNMVQYHFGADVDMKCDRPPYLDIAPDEVKITGINGHTDPWTYHTTIWLDCEYLFFLLLDRGEEHFASEVRTLINEIYLVLLPLDELFHFVPYRAPGHEKGLFSNRCMFREVTWHCPDEEAITYGEEDDDTGDGMELFAQDLSEENAEPDDTDEYPDNYDGEGEEETYSGLHLPGPVEEKIMSALWPYAQVAYSNLGFLYRNLRLLSMAIYENPAIKGIPAIKGAIEKLKIPTIVDQYDGPTAQEQHFIGIPFPSEN